MIESLSKVVSWKESVWIKTFDNCKLKKKKKTSILDRINCYNLTNILYIIILFFLSIFIYQSSEGIS